MKSHDLCFKKILDLTMVSGRRLGDYRNGKQGHGNIEIEFQSSIPFVNILQE